MPMEEKYLQYLLDRYLTGTATEPEKEKLNEWYAKSNDEDVIWEADSLNEQLDVERRMRNKIINHIELNRTPIFRLTGRFIGRIAAGIIGLLLVSGLYYLKVKNNNNAPFKSASVIAPIKFSENKYIILPDGSTILLHPGSRIHYDFKVNVRELTLVGEAYFDIKHMSDRPFVIHTGKVTTTVLGTAFNIKAYAGQQVVVSVTRGKVSVGDETKKLLAILTPNQEVEYSFKSKVATQENVKAIETIKWVKADMQFDAMTYKELAEKLERRYDVHFNFNNPKMEKCLITGRFTGTEPIEQVLHIISETLGTNYKIEGNKVTVDGKECKQ
jgi:transmembrane sensor